MTDFGRVIAVNKKHIGDQLTATAATSATTLQIGDASDFAVSGGTISTAVGLLVYLSADPETNVVTLASPLPSPGLPDEAPIILWDTDSGRALSELVATVELEGLDGIGETAEMEVPPGGLRAQLKPYEGIAQGPGIQVEVEYDEDGTAKIAGTPGSEEAPAFVAGSFATDEEGFNRVVIRDSAGDGYIEFYSGLSDETAPAFIKSNDTGRSLRIVGPEYTGYQEGFIDLISRLSSDGDGGRITLTPTLDNGAKGETVVFGDRLTLGETKLIAHHIDTDIGVTSIVFDSDVNFGGNQINGGIHISTGDLDVDTLGGTGVANVQVGAGGLFSRATSSLRFKKNVGTYQPDLAQLRKLRPIHFRFKNREGRPADDKVYAGFAAEQMEELGFEEFVTRDDEGRVDGILYPDLTVALFAMIQDLYHQVESEKGSKR